MLCNFGHYSQWEVSSWEDEKTGQSASSGPGRAAACTRHLQESRKACGRQERAASSNPNMRGDGSHLSRAPNLKTKINTKSKLSFADDGSTKSVVSEGWESTFLLLCLVPTTTVSPGGNLPSRALGKEDSVAHETVRRGRQTIHWRKEGQG